jgi:hypothetical protein
MSVLRPTLRQLVATLMLLPALASHAASAPPADVQASLPAGQTLLTWEAADLNRDGRVDLVTVSEASAQQDDDGPRLLQVWLRQPDGKLKLAIRSERAVMCRQCGGVFGDPFEGIQTQAGGFTLLHYGGSNWRWREDFRFAWSRRDQTWQLVAVDSLSFHTSAPDKQTSKHARPPRDFGLINLADFDYENWQGRGQR